MSTNAKSAVVAAVAALVIGGAGIGQLAKSAAAQPIVERSSMTLKYQLGDEIPMILDSPISSSTAQVGDTFTATVDSSQPGFGRLGGAYVKGHVTWVRASEGVRPGGLGLQIDTLTTRNGHAYDIQTAPISIDDAIDAHGDYVRSAETYFTYPTGVPGMELYHVRSNRRDVALNSGIRIGVVLRHSFDVPSSQPVF